MKHDLKILAEHYLGQVRGWKTFELRKDDRVPRFEPGDELELFLWDPERGYRGPSVVVRATHVLRDCDGLAPGYCIMSTTSELGR